MFFEVPLWQSDGDVNSSHHSKHHTRELVLPFEARTATAPRTTTGGIFSFVPDSENTQNRFIAWSANGPQILLKDTSFAHTLVNNTLSIIFPAPVLDNGGVVFEEQHVSSDGGSIVILVLFVITRHSLHRLTFTHPSQLASPSISVFTSVSLDDLLRPGLTVHIVNLCKGFTPTSACCIQGNNTIVVATRDALFLEEFSPLQLTSNSSNTYYNETEIREGSALQRLWTGWWNPGKDIVFITAYERYLFSVSTDSRLRVWSLDKRCCFGSTPISWEAITLVKAPTEAKISPVVQHQRLLVFPAPSNNRDFQAVVVVYSPLYVSHTQENFQVDSCFSKYHSFQVIDVRLLQNGEISLISRGYHHYFCSDIECTRTLIDCSIDLKNNTLWALWERLLGTDDAADDIARDCDSTLLLYTPLIDTSRTENHLTESHMWNAVVLHDPFYGILKQDIKWAESQDIFFDRLFDVCRLFPLSIICQALSYCCEESITHVGQDLSSDVSSTTAFVEQLRTEVALEIQSMAWENARSIKELNEDVDISGPDLESYQNSAVQTAWKKFVMWLNRSWRGMDTNYRPWLSVSLQYSSQLNTFLLLRQGTVSLIRPCAQVEKVKGSLSSLTGRLTHSLSIIEELLGEHELSSIESDLTTGQAPIILATQAVATRLSISSETNADSAAQREELLMEALDVFGNGLLGSGEICSSTIHVFKKFLQSLHQPTAFHQSLRPVIGSAPTYKCAPGSLCGHAISVTCGRLAEAQFRRAVSLLCLLRCLFEKMKTPITTELSSLLSDTSNIVMSSFIVLWISRLRTATADSDWNVSQFSTLQIAPKVATNKVTSVIELLFYENQINLLRSALTSVPEDVTLPPLSSLVLPISLAVLSSLWPDNVLNVLSFVSFLHRHGQYISLLEISRIVASALAAYGDQYLDTIGALYHFSGIAHLNMGHYDIAFTYFCRACELGLKFVLSILGDYTNEKLSTSGGNSLQSDTSVQYYLHVSRLFESHKQHDLVISCAEAALAFTSPTDNIAIPYLWSTVFTHSIELRDFDKAYYAIMNNPDPERSLDCLRRFVVVCCTSGALDKLVSYSFPGKLTDIIGILQHKAHLQDIGTVENSHDGASQLQENTKHTYYYYLYSFCVYHCFYRLAASSMIESVYRLRTESHGISSFQKQAHGLLLSINSLRLVDLEFQWLPSPDTTSVSKMNSTIQSKRKRDDSSGLQGVQSSMPLSVLELADLEREYAVVKAHIALAENSIASVVQGKMLTGSDTIGLLIQANLFSEAFRLASLVDTTYDLGPLFEALTRRALSRVEMSRDDSTKPSWHQLRRFLERYGNNSSRSRYHLCVARIILETDIRLRLPIWLSSWFRDNDPAPLLGLYLDHNMLEEAISLTTTLVSYAQEKLSPISSSVWLPYTHIEHLLSRLRSTIPSSPILHSLEQNLAQYFKNVEKHNLVLQSHNK